MEIRFPRCAGIDVHKRTVVACRIVLTDDGEWLRETRTYGTTSADLLRLSDWLAAGDCTHVGLEGTVRAGLCQSQEGSAPSRARARGA